mgnify:CR=1 FL=1
MSEKILQYFYRSVKNLDNGEAEFCDVYQVLPGGASTALFYSVAYDFDEISKLNEETFKVAAKYAHRLYEREYIDELRLCFSPCVDFISSDESFKNFLNFQGVWSGPPGGKTLLSGPVFHGADESGFLPRRL